MTTVKIICAFTDKGSPKTGLSSTVTVWKLPNTRVVDAQAMTEITDGLSGGMYQFAWVDGAEIEDYNPSEDYAIRCDSADGTMSNSDRYKFSSNDQSGDAVEARLPSDPADQSEVEAAISVSETAVIAEVDENEGKIDTIQGNVTDVLSDTNEMQGKLPTNYIMGSSNPNDQDQDFNQIVIDIVDDVWDEAIADHSGELTFGGKNQRHVPSETLNDYKADISGIVTSGELENHDAKLDLAQLDLDILTGVDGVTLATLQSKYAPAKSGDEMNLVDDAITSVKFDESTAFPIRLLDSGETQIARINDIPTVDEISNNVWDEPVSDHLLFGSFGESVIKLLGLSQENYYLDNTSYVTYQGSKLLTSGRIRTYPGSGELASLSGELAIYTITAVWNDDELQTYQVSKQ